MLHPFFGGVHPIEHKDLTEQKIAIPLPEAPAQVVIPLSMHIGAPCVPTVVAGDTVKVGQPIGEPQGLGAVIHSSVSGTVLAVEPRPCGGGGNVLSVVIENDFRDTPFAKQKRREVESLPPGEILNVIRDAGITGMGGAGFPTYTKVSGGIGRVDTLIINGAECEPYITADYRLMLENSAAVVGGARLLARAVGAKKTLIAVEDNKPEAAEVLRSCLNTDEECKVQILPTRYPQGAEKQLIYALLGRQVPSGKLPADVGCLVCNVATAAAVWEAATEGKALTHRRVTVTGCAVKAPANYIVPIGTPVDWLIQQTGGFQMQPERVVLGGPMMGTAISDLSVPVMKATNCVLCLTEKETAKSAPTQTCIRCGKCVEACPMQLMPLLMRMNAEKHRWAETEKLHVMDCIECGSCNYICPAGLPLVQTFRMAKFSIRQQVVKAKEQAAVKVEKEEATS